MRKKKLPRLQYNTTHLDRTLYAQLRALAKRTGIPATVMIRWGCEQAIQKYKAIADRGWTEDGEPRGESNDVDTKPTT